ncbi:MAG: cadmium carbonic anhydrase, partial [Alphaproteobacteria bacterium]
MRKPTLGLAVATGLLLAPSAPGQAADICNGYGPQAPRDIASAAGVNPRAFAAAPPSTAMNLYNIHFHA